MLRSLILLSVIVAVGALVYPSIWDASFLRYEFEGGGSTDSPNFFDDSTRTFNLKRSSGCSDYIKEDSNGDGGDFNTEFLGEARNNRCSLSSDIITSNTSTAEVKQGFANIESTSVWSAFIAFAAHFQENYWAPDSSVIFALADDEGITSGQFAPKNFTKVKLGLFFIDTLDVGFYSYYNNRTNAFRTSGLSANHRFSTEAKRYVALVSNGTDVSLYINKVKFSVSPASQNFSYNSSASTGLRFSVGSVNYNGRRMFNGHVFRIALWDRALSEAEIGTLTDSGINGITRSACPAGTKRNEYFERVVCEDCPDGAVSSALDSSSCSLCETGKYAWNHVECKYCPEGYAVSPDKNSCFKCNGTQYSLNKIECVQCPLNSATYASNSKKSDCLCDVGYFGGFGVNDTGECISCKNDPRLGCSTVGTLLPQVPPGIRIPNFTGDIAVYTCFNPKACQQNECSQLYTGTFCGQCIPGKSFRIGTRCYSCTGSETGLGFLYLFIALFIAIVTFLFLRVSVPNTAKVHAIGLTFSWFQTLALFESLPANWPSSVHSTVRVLSFANFNIEFLSPECFNSFTFWDKWALKLMLPLIIFGTAGIFFSIQLLMEKKFPNSLSVFTLPLVEIITRGKKTKPSIFKSTYSGDRFKRSRYVFFFVFVMTVLYTHLSSTSLQPLNCKYQPGDGKWYVVYSPDIECYSKEWNSKLGGIIFTILLYPVGIPIFILLVFMKFEGRIFSESFMSNFGCLTMPYHRKYYYWELVSMFRRAIMAILIDFFSQYPSLYVQIFFGTFILFLLLVAQAVAQPYKSREINLLSITWIITAVICLFSTVVFPAANINEDEKSFFAAIVVLCIVVESIISLLVAVMESKTNKKFQATEIEKNQLFFEIREEHVQQLKVLFPTMYNKIWTQLAQLSMENQEKVFKEIVKVTSKLSPEEVVRLQNYVAEDFEENAALASEAFSRDDSTLAYKPDTRTGFKAVPSEDVGMIQMIVPSIREETQK